MAKRKKDRKDDNGWSRTSGERSRARRAVNGQQKRANIRAKYGPSGRPSPVVVKSLATGEVLAVQDQSKFAPRLFADSLERMAHEAGYASYAAYLRSPCWRRLRELVLARDGRRCTRCRTRANLTVHHRYYVALGAESLRSLTTLCGRCHRRAHS